MPLVEEARDRLWRHHLDPLERLIAMLDVVGGTHDRAG